MASAAGGSSPAGLQPFALPPELLGILNQGKAVGYTNVAFLMLLVYDHLLTFGTEVATVWTLPWGLPKVMFIINRYIVPPMLFFDGITPSLKLGQELQLHSAMDRMANPAILKRSRYHSADSCIRNLFVNFLLYFRRMLTSSGIDGNKKIIVWALYSFYVLTFIPFLALAIMVSLHTSASPTKGTLFTDCIFSAPSYYYAAWIPPTLFESVLIFLTLIRTVQFDKVNPTLRVLARDSIVYFFVIFAILLANTFIAKFGEGFIGAALIVPCSVTACIAAARMMMNIRMMVPEIAQEMTHISTQKIEFKHGQSLMDSNDSTTVAQSSENTLEGSPISPVPRYH